MPTGGADGGHLIPGRVQNIVTSKSVCLSARITRTSHGQTSPNVLCMLPVVVVLSPFSGVAIFYVLPVLWMMPCVHIMALRRVMSIPVSGLTEHDKHDGRDSNQILLTDEDQPVLVVSCA